jgi:hypothetical protein
MSGAANSGRVLLPKVFPSFFDAPVARRGPAAIQTRRESRASDECRMHGIILNFIEFLSESL